jgi:hypothetical protein
MANKKITELTAAASVSATDLVPVVADPSGTPTTKKSTIQKIFDLLLGAARTFSSSVTASSFISGTQKFSSPLSFSMGTSSTTPTMVVEDSNGEIGGAFRFGWTGGGSNEKYWDFGAVFQGLDFRKTNDDGSTAKAIMQVKDTGLRFSDYGGGGRYLWWQTDGNGNIGGDGGSIGRPDNVYVKTLTKTAKLCVTTPTVPANASDTGVAGTIAWDSDYIYLCTATNTWKRVGIATW